MKVALDTNVLVSAVATRGLCADIFNLVLAQHQLVVGVTVLAELKRVLRQKIRVPGKIVQEVDAFLRREAVVAGKTKALTITIRDKSDVPVLAEAVAAGAEVLVTGDRDLLEITDKLPIRILTPRGLWEQLRNDAAPSR
ncbi:MAG: putative toxin-antitoxin system toxin component, PIN family [Woeseiaceae bacterium]